MLLSATIRTIGRRAGFTSLLNQQTKSQTRLTPILSYHHFRCEEDKFVIQTGFLKERKFNNKSTHLHKTIHCNNGLLFKYSNLLEQKVKQNDQQSRPEEKTAAELLELLEENKKLGLFARFKKMAKDYWYVLIPVHVATSCVWLGAFYYTSKSGVNIVGILEYYEFNEKIVNHLKNSHLGHIAIAYFLYKVATPARYAVTLGSTTFAIKFLSQRGIIKPMPSRDKLVQIYKDKKDDMKQKMTDKKDDMKQKQQAFRDKYMKKDD